MDISLIALSFLEGLGLILSPCILPILPLILATGIQGGRLRPYGIISGFITTFVLFTLFARNILSALDIDPITLQDAAIYMILGFGIVLYSDSLSAMFTGWSQNIANKGQKFTSKAEANIPSGFFSGLVIGGVIALIWTPCAGPIMAAVLVQTLQQKANSDAAMILTAFSIGVGIPMLIITIFSKSILNSIRKVSHHTEIIRKVLAVIIIVTMLFTKFNVWQKIIDLSGPSMATNSFLPATRLIDPLAQPYPTAQLVGIQRWINSQPLTLEQLKKQGKVVLIDFWTYSCINCIRTLPYIKSWHEKYHDKGLVIIGVHSPEFEFEKNEINVERAVQDYGIKYPVAMDSDLKTFENFQNQYWPAHYLINKDGQVVYIHHGEGKYDVTENNIRYLLGLGTMKDYVEPVTEVKPFSPEQSPETYLGAKRANNFASDQDLVQGKTTEFSFPKKLNADEWALEGKWKVEDERITSAEPGAKLRFHFRAKQVYLVMATATYGKAQKVRITFNGKFPTNGRGKDVDIKTSELKVDHSTLYELLNFREMTDGILEIEAESPGLEAFAFTFGSQ